MRKNFFKSVTRYGTFYTTELEEYKIFTHIKAKCCRRSVQNDQNTWKGEKPRCPQPFKLFIRKVKAAHTTKCYSLRKL